MQEQKRKTALLLGATGLVGRHLLRQLLDDHRYTQVTCLLRKPIPGIMYKDHEDKCEPIVVDFEQLEDYQGYFGVDHVYVCLGTTIKQAGSKSAFRKVDFEYVHVAAQLARAQRAKGFVWISSVGASAKSGNFYLRVKGELEDAIINMSGLEHAATVRPSFLLGHRSESRPGENVGIMLANLFAPVLVGPLKKYRPVHADTVAKQMINLQPWEHG